MPENAAATSTLTLLVPQRVCPSLKGRAWGAGDCHRMECSLSIFWIYVAACGCIVIALKHILPSIEVAGSIITDHLC